MKLSKLGICGILSLLSYMASVFISPIKYPGYNWMSMAVSELSATNAPSRELAIQLNSLFGPCGIVCIMAACVAAYHFKSRLLRVGIYFFAAMEWVTVVGYEMFPYVNGVVGFSFQNTMHVVVTALVVLLSISSMIMIAIGAKKDGFRTLQMWAIICFAAMMGGALGSGILPKAVFGIAERCSMISVVVFNAVIGVCLLNGEFNVSVEH